MPIGYNCRHCGHSPKKGKRIGIFKRVFKRRSEEQIYDMVKEYVLGLDVDSYFRKERIAVKLSLKEHEVAQALHKLNLEGIVAQPIHKPPHDSTRDKYGCGDSAWQGDAYRLMRK